MKKRWLILLICLAACLPALGESTPTSDQYKGRDYTLTAFAESSGMRVRVTVDFRNSGDKEASVTVRNIALDGECTGASFTLKAAPGASDSRTSLWQKGTLGSLTVVEVWAEVNISGRSTEAALLTILPLGEKKVSRRFLSGDEKTYAAFDDLNAGVRLCRLTADSPENGISFEWYLINKADELIRFVITARGDAGNSLDTPAVYDLIPHTVCYAPALVPGDTAVTFRIAGYLPGNDMPLFQTDYPLDVSSPRAVPTLKPTAAPGPYRIGTVTVRKSGDVNVREEGSTGARKVGSAKAGKSYPCFGVAETGWYLIELEDGTRGYITDKYTTLKRE